MKIYYSGFEKSLIFLIVSILLLSISCSKKTAQDVASFPTLNGPYLGQTPPGRKAELFAPGIISTEDNEALIGILHNGSCFIFDRQPIGFTDWDKDPVYICQETDGKWDPPVLTKNLGKPWYLDYPNPSHGLEINYTWWLPLDENGKVIHIDIWRATYKQDQWEEPEKLQYPINTDRLDAWPSLTKEGVLYFHSNREGGLGRSDIYMAVPIGGKYDAVVNLGDKINTPGLEHDPCIAPDGSFLVFSSNRESSLGKDDLYVSFPGKNGAWSDPINLGPGVNSESSENRPFLTEDGKYLFFTSTRNENLDVFWVDSTIISEIKIKRN